MEIRGISGMAQLDVLGKALARVDLSKKPKPFCELFTCTSTNIYCCFTGDGLVRENNKGK